MDGPSFWDGRTLIGEYVAMTVKAAPAQEVADVPHDLFAGACDGSQVIVVQAKQLGAFLNVHTHSWLACYNAAAFHWLLDAHLHATAEDDARRILWDFSRSHRLIDIGLLDQLVTLGGNGTVRPPALPLRALAGCHGGVSAPDGAGQTQVVAPATLAERIPDELLEAATSEVIAVFQMYRALGQRVSEINAVAGSSQAAFGPLGLGLQVQGAIAAEHAARNGLHIGPGTMTGLVQALSGVQNSCINQLTADRKAKACFKQDDNKVRLDHLGFPEFRPRTLAKWLESVLRELQDRHRVGFVPPGAEDVISTCPEDWGVLVRCHRFLRAWADLLSASRLRLHFQKNQVSVIHPQYQILPRIGSDKPSLDDVRRSGLRVMFRPSNGHCFLVIQLCDLDLRALAAVCLQRYSTRELAAVFQSGRDVAVHTAARLSMMEPAAFARLETEDHDRHTRWIRSARAALFAVPRGLGVAELREIARSDFDVELSLGEARDVDQRLLTVYPELAEYLRDDAGNLLAANLRTTDKAIGELLEAHVKRFKPRDLRNAFRAQRKVKGNIDSRLWATLEHGNNNPTLKPLFDKKEFGPALYRALSGRDVLVQSGRVRGRLPFSDARQVEYLDLADDAMKAVLYDLVAAGFRLVGFAGFEIVLEVEESDAKGRAGSAKEIAKSCLQKVLSSVPVLCSDRISTVW
jgi:hypothetical protein